MNMSNLMKFGVTVTLSAGLGVACAPPPITQECIPVDEHLGKSVVQWCDGITQPEYDPDSSWNGKPADEGFPVCIAPQSDGACQVCPREEVLPLVEERMTELLATSDCQPEHWELGCMRTEEEGMKLGWGPDGSHYCCFEVAVWGPGCEE